MTMLLILSSNCARDFKEADDTAMFSTHRLLNQLSSSCKNNINTFPHTKYLQQIYRKYLLIKVQLSKRVENIEAKGGIASYNTMFSKCVCCRGIRKL